MVNANARVPVKPRRGWIFTVFREVRRRVFKAFLLVPALRPTKAAGLFLLLGFFCCWAFWVLTFST
jgi:hypothetical protein